MRKQIISFRDLSTTTTLRTAGEPFDGGWLDPRLFVVVDFTQQVSVGWVNNVTYRRWGLRAMLFFKIWRNKQPHFGQSSSSACITLCEALIQVNAL